MSRRDQYGNQKGAKKEEIWIIGFFKKRFRRSRPEVVTGSLPRRKYTATQTIPGRNKR